MLRLAERADDDGGPGSGLPAGPKLRSHFRRCTGQTLQNYRKLFSGARRR